MLKMAKKTMMNRFILVLSSAGMYSSITVLVTSTPRNISIKNISKSVPVAKNKIIMYIMVPRVICIDMFCFFSMINNGQIIPRMIRVILNLMFKGFCLKSSDILINISINPIITALRLI